MSGRWPFVAEKIAARLALIAPHIHARRLVLPPFRILPLPGAIVDAPICADPAGWDEIPHRSYWGHADLNFVMKTTFAVPQGWDPSRLALHLPLGVLGDIFTHPEALVHIDTVPIGSADRYHHTLPLDAHLADGQGHVLSLHGWTGLSGWPPDPASRAQLYMGEPALVERDPDLLAFHRLAAAALDTLRTLGPADAAARGLLAALDAAFLVLDTRAPLADALHASAPFALTALRDGIAEAGAPLDVTVHGIGHAHMDIAYLWTIDQIRLKNARTYSNVLRLMEEDPSYVFSHSQPQLYAMCAADYPALFDRIKTRVAEGRWEAMGGMWVEPDLHIPGPEALIRQLTLGRGYFRDTFGEVDTPVLWLPDTFGFPAQIPQLMRLAGLGWFVTNKLNWNQLNPVPSSTHHWEGLDGSRVIAHILTTPRDVQYLPFPTNYKSDLSAAEVLGTWTRSTAPDSLRDLPICYGYGDGGGGPTEDLLAKGRAYAAMPGMPVFRPGTVRALFERIEAQAADLPVWRGEHYMEGHRGTYTSQGWIKRANRKAEWALHEAEAMAAMAGQRCDLTEAWQLLCLNQFHDIVTGTSIGAVFDDARRDFARVAEMAEAAAGEAATALALSGDAVVNTSPVSGPRLALVDAGQGSQEVEGGALAFFAYLPSYAVAPLSADTMPAQAVTVRKTGDTIVLENAHVTATLTASGHLTSLRDSATGHEVLAPGGIGNRLLAFEDRPICWDAWDIDPTYEDRPETVSGPTTCEIVETGPLRACVSVTTRWRSSTIRQRIALCAHSARLDFVTELDWHERHTLLKAAFPTSVAAPEATYDIQWGHVARSTARDSDFDAARFEVPAQKWARLAGPVHAVAVLNDCKYGYDVLGGTIRITLVKCATMPDPEADQGQHLFTYSLLPHATDRPQDLDREAYDLNAPLRVVAAGKGSGQVPALAPAFGVSAAAPPPAGPRPLVKSTNPDVILQTVKPADDGRGIIVRAFEARGRAAQTRLVFGRAVARAEVSSIFETAEDAGSVTVAVTGTVRGADMDPLDAEARIVSVTLAPFAIGTFRIVLAEV